jgi:hypothetical protein
MTATAIAALMNNAESERFARLAEPCRAAAAAKVAKE